ncbi:MULTISPECIES: hypothetical protein [Streptomyces]|uniref:hypothetical protein n=1 Tax=Streptomyces TaxID=1883 RepID=UPI001B38B444|nr:hypothetical protein [Streptomyces sp. B15]MBQ1120857.1 hypothetical protein [Streptomyces sp. B15]
MPTRKPPTSRRAKECPDCKGAGEIRETVRVGARKNRVTEDKQSALCTECWGSGEAQ